MPSTSMTHGRMPRLEIALLVEHRVVRQLLLAIDGGDAAVAQHGDRVVAAAAVALGKADDDRRAPHARGERGELARAGVEKGRAQHEVLGRIAAQRQFGRDDQARARASGLGRRREDRARHCRRDRRGPDSVARSRSAWRPRLQSKSLARARRRRRGRMRRADAWRRSLPATPARMRESFACRWIPPPPLPSGACRPLTVRDDVAIEAIDAAAVGRAAPAARRSLRTRSCRALHETGCASPATGWTPRYLTAWRGRGAVPARCRCTSRPTRTASTCSTGRGRTPIAATGAATTRSSWPRFRSRPRRDRGCFARDAATRGALIEAALAPAASGARAGACRFRRCTCCFRPRARCGALEARGHADPARIAVPLGERRLSRLRRLPFDVQSRQAKEGEAGAAQGRRGRRQLRAQDRRRDHAPPTGRSSIAATRTPIATITRRRTCRSSSSSASAQRMPGQRAAGARASRRHARLRGARRFRCAARCGAAIGARPITFPACISRPATTRPSSSASSGGSRISKAARRACTSSRADSRRCRHGRRTRSPIRISPARSASSARASASTSRTPSTSSARRARSGTSANVRTLTECYHSRGSRRRTLWRAVPSATHQTHLETR